MLAMAEKGDWDTLAEQEKERQKRIDQFFSKNPTTDQVPFVAEGIKKILQIDRATVALGEAGRQHAADALNKMTQGKRALRAYSSTA